MLETKASHSPKVDSYLRPMHAVVQLLDHRVYALDQLTELLGP